MEKIAFIGTGIMGLPMAGNLQKAGYRLNVYTRTRSRAQSLTDAGALWCSSPAQAAENADVVISCVTDTPDVRNVYLGPEGVINSAASGLICVDMSTISPEATREIASELAGKGVGYIDAPISGGQIGAQQGKLAIMAGGEKEHLDKVMKIFEVMGRKITHCGPVGSGQMTKLVNQIMVIHTIMSISEGFAFAEAAGLDPETTFEAVNDGAAASHSLTNLGAKIIAGDLKPAFMVDLQMKDLKLVLEYAAKLNQSLPGTALAAQLMTALQAAGRGTDGTQALVDVIRSLGPGAKGEL